MNALIIALGVMLALGGILVAIINWIMPAQKNAAAPDPRMQILVSKIRNRLDRRTWIFAGAGLAVGVVVAMFTGWLVFIIFLPALALTARVLFADQGEKQHTERLFQMESWVRSLAGLIVTGAALETALVGSLSNAGEAIRPQLTRMVARIQGGWTTEESLKALGKDWNDATGDLVVMNLILAARQRGQGLANALEDLSLAVAEEVRIRRKITADRAAPRRQARIVAGFTVAALLIVPMMGGPMATYRTPLGQAIYLALASLVVVLLFWMNRSIAPKNQPRLMVSTEGGA